MHNVVITGLSCLAMALVLFAADPLDFNPDPVLQGLVWVGFAAWCFGIVWSDRKNRGRIDPEGGI